MVTRKRSTQAGFTLIEIIMAVFILGVVSMLASGALRAFIGAKTAAQQQKQVLVNQQIANAMLNYAKNPPTAGAAPALPAPYTNSGTSNYSAIAAVTGTSGLTPYLLQEGVSPSLFNDDGNAVPRVRSYQKVTVPLAGYPLFGASGPTVNLDYDFGIIYQTDCPKNNTACNTALPRNNAGTNRTALSATNYNSYAQLTGDFGVTYVSTLPLQKALLSRFLTQIDNFRVAVRDFRDSGWQTCANSYSTLPACAAGSTGSAACRKRPANWFSAKPGGFPTSNNPTPVCFSSTHIDNTLPNPTQAEFNGWTAVTNPVTQKNSNMGCWDGWYGLDSGNYGPALLAGLGLNVEEYGSTPWGGTIQYCADYDPLPSTPTTCTTVSCPSYGLGVAPNYVAIRFLKDVTKGTGATGSLSNPNDVVVVSW